MMDGTPIRSDAANFFETELTQDMIATATEAVVLTTSGAPTSPCYLVIDPDEPLKREVIYFDGEFDGTTFTTTSLTNRYLDGSAGDSIVHETGAKVISAPVAQMLRDMHARIDNSPPIGVILFWSGSIETIPDGWALCDGTNGTPDLRGLFIVGAGGAYAVGATGGANSVTLTGNQMPAHDHAMDHTHSVNNHNHGGSTGSGGSHIHSVGMDTNAAGNSEGFVRQTTANTGLATSAAPNHSHTIPTQTGLATGASTRARTVSSGGGAAHENRPPFYALALIQRIA